MLSIDLQGGDLRIVTQQEQGRRTRFFIVPGWQFLSPDQQGIDTEIPRIDLVGKAFVLIGPMLGPRRWRIHFPRPDLC